MAKDALTSYSTTAASNTDVGGVGIQGTNAISNADDAVREIMSHLAETNAGTSPWADTMTIGDAADITKEFRFEASGITAGQTRVLTVPDASGTLMLSASFPTAASLEGLTLGAGDMIYATAADTLTDLAIGTAGQFLVTNAGATAPEWASCPTLVSLEGLSLVAGDALYATAADTLARLAKGTAGQLFRMNSGATAPEWGSSLDQNSPTSLSSTTTTITGIPSWVKKVTISVVGMSTNGTSNPLIKIGPSGGVETGSYSSGAGTFTGTSTSCIRDANGFKVTASHVATDSLSGIITLISHNSSNTWALHGSLVSDVNNTKHEFSGSKALAGALERIAFTTTGGTDTFDAGTVTLSWE